MKPSKVSFAMVVVLLIAGAARAVTTQYFVDRDSADFKAGKTENLVIHNTGKMSLGAQMTKLLESRTDVSTVFDVRVLPDGSILAATGPEGRLLIYRDKKWDTLYKAEQPYIFSMEIGKNGRIYLGTGGETGRVLAVSNNGKEAKTLFETKDIQYIWNLKELPDGRLAAATGPTGKLFLIDPAAGKPAGTEIFSCKQKNLQAMAVGKDGTIYVGTDTEGIVYKVEPRGGDKYVGRALYDAKEEEISVLAVDPNGVVYAATASENSASDQARSYLTKPAGTPSTSSAPAATTSAPASQSVSGKDADEMSDGGTVPATMPQKTPAAADQQKHAAILKRMMAQRKGKPAEPPGGPPAMRRSMSMMKMMTAGSPPTPSAPSGKGNAVYRIDPMGFVTEVFRDQVNINSMIVDHGKLYLGTGPDGYIFVVTPATEEVALYAKSGAGYVNSLRLARDRSLILGTGSPAQVIKLGPALAAAGVFTSKVFDASQIARWGVVDVTLAPPAAGKLLVQTRSSALANQDNPGWSEWSKPQEVGKSPVYITAPAARFLQYKLTLEPAGSASPSVDKVQVAYMQDNQRPQISAVNVITGQPEKASSSAEGDGEGPSEGPPMPMMGPKPAAPKMYRFMWKASDPNSDTLRYDLYLRRVGTPYWIRLEKDLSQAMMPWDPHTVPDGQYELKVVASDKLANPVGMGLTQSRVSDEFTVDNTAPVVRNLKCTIEKSGKLQVEADLVDETSEIAGAWICVNAGKDWQYVAPVDEIYDSKTEKIDAVVPFAPADGSVLLTIKVTDAAGNIGYAWQLVPAAPQAKDATDDSRD